jgi:hypothetical protein
MFVIVTGHVAIAVATGLAPAAMGKRTAAICIWGAARFELRIQRYKRNPERLPMLLIRTRILTDFDKRNAASREYRGQGYCPVPIDHHDSHLESLPSAMLPWKEPPRPITLTDEMNVPSCTCK